MRRPLRIGIMARTLTQRYGVGVYTENFLRALAETDSGHDLVVFLPEAADERLPRGASMEPVVVPALNKALWDQIAVPRAAVRAGVDFLFNTKFTVPLSAPCPTGMYLHGSMWFVHPELCNRLDNLYLRAVMPRYLGSAALLATNSQLTARDHERLYPRQTGGKLRVLPLAAGDGFQPVQDRAALAAVRRRYGLPERFWLTVSRRDPRKNLPALFAAYAQLPHPRLPLVAAGGGSYRYEAECDFAELGIAGDVLFPGFVPQEDLPAVYAQAEALVFPSIYEEFGIPLVEAMCCGCPVVAARTGALPEVAGEAAIYVDPHSPADIAAGMARLAGNEALRGQLKRGGLERGGRFRWSDHAAAFLEAVELVCRSPASPRTERPSYEGARHRPLTGVRS